MSSVAQFATPTGFQQVLEGPFDCAFDEIRFIESAVEESRKQQEINEGRAFKGCVCPVCQDIRYFHPFRAEAQLKHGIPSLQTRGRA